MLWEETPGYLQEEACMLGGVGRLGYFEHLAEAPAAQARCLQV